MSSTFAESVSPEELAKMEKDAEEVMAKLSACRGTRAALEKEVAELEQEIVDIDAKLSRYALDVTAMTEKGEALQAQVQQARGATINGHPVLLPFFLFLFLFRL